MNNKFLGMLGLAKRAGKVQTGEDICSKAVKSGVSKLIIVACDASDNTKKSITDSCKFHKTKFVEAGSKAELGKFTGADSGGKIYARRGQKRTETGESAERRLHSVRCLREEGGACGEIHAQGNKGDR